VSKDGPDALVHPLPQNQGVGELVMIGGNPITPPRMSPRAEMSMAHLQRLVLATSAKDAEETQDSQHGDQGQK
jgi:hypothetical protein